MTIMGTVRKAGEGDSNKCGVDPTINGLVSPDDELRWAQAPAGQLGHDTTYATPIHRSKQAAAQSFSFLLRHIIASSRCSKFDLTNQTACEGQAHTMFRAQSNVFDDVVVKATDENLTSENWEYILVCDIRCELGCWDYAGEQLRASEPCIWALGDYACCSFHSKLLLITVTGCM